MKKIGIAVAASLLIGGAALAQAPLAGTNECAFLNYHLPIGGSSLNKGQQAYNKNCASCHGEDGTMLESVKLNDPKTWHYGSKPRNIFRTLTFGLPESKAPTAQEQAQSENPSENPSKNLNEQKSKEPVAKPNESKAVTEYTHQFASFNKKGNMTADDIWNTSAYLLSKSFPLQAVKCPSGLQYVILSPGEGATAQRGNQVEAHYTGWLTNGMIFDTSYPRHKAFSFSLGAGQVIRGWDEGVVGMRVGELRQLLVPASLGYGARSTGSIPPNSTLIFQVELVGIK